MQSTESKKKYQTSVSCQGKEYPYDHPKVYLEIDPEIKKIDCPYCGKTFKLQ